MCIIYFNIHNFIIICIYRWGSERQNSLLTVSQLAENWFESRFSGLRAHIVHFFPILTSIKYNFCIMLVNALYQLRPNSIKQFNRHISEELWCQRSLQAIISRFSMFIVPIYTIVPIYILYYIYYTMLYCTILCILYCMFTVPIYTIYKNSLHIVLIYIL